MKKKIFLAATAALLVTTAAAFVYANNKSADDDFWNRNVEALGSSEGSVTGHCENSSSYLCGAYCPNCYSRWEAPADHHGPAYSVSGTCVCGYTGSFTY